jgi:hypothetical protein
VDGSSAGRASVAAQGKAYRGTLPDFFRLIHRPRETTRRSNTTDSPYACLGIQMVPVPGR